MSLDTAARFRCFAPFLGRTAERARLKDTGCGKLFEEKISGAARARPALEQLLQELRVDDIVVVTRLDRLARSTAELLRIAEVIRERDA